MDSLPLEKGVVYFDQIHEEDQRSSRIQISSGTELATHSRHKGKYCFNGFVAREPWRMPTPDEMSILSGSADGLVIGLWLTIVAVPEAVIKAFAKLKQASAETHDLRVLQSLVRSSQAQEGVNEFFKYASTYSMSTDQPIEGGGISLHPPGLETLSYDYKNDCFVGLHLDSWYKDAIPDRPRSPNRICVNLGAEPRYLLYINLPMPRILEIVQPQASLPGERKRIHVDFMNLYPDYPVVKIAINPGEAYIAPTENVIHDGSSTGKNSLDVSLTYRGRLNFKQVAS